MVSNGRELADIALAALNDVAIGAEFKLIDLVDLEVWSRARIGVRRAAGTTFLARMMIAPGIECLGRDLENHQRYRKVG